MNYCKNAFKTLLLPVLALTVVIQVNAQRLKKAEYFFDNDPGIGKGTQVTLPAAKNADSTFTFNVSALTNGLHFVYVRAQDTSGTWGLAYSASFIKTMGGTTGGGGVNYVASVEYFFDKDPGFGNATQVSIAGGKASVDSAISFNVATLPNGLHTLYVRARDINQNWGLAYNSSFIKQLGNDSMLSIKNLEYYLDVDPGFGNGIQLPITAAANINDTFNFVIPDNGANSRTLYVRVQDSRGSWSLLYDSTINLCQLYKTKANFGWVRFGSLYSFIDSSQNNPSHKLLWQFDNLGTDSVSNPQFNFPQGNHFVTLVAGNRQGCRADSITLPIFVGLEKYYPNTALTGGDIIINFYGGGLDTNAVVTLVNGSTSITPYAKAAYDLQAFAGVFDLHTAPAGVYDINVLFSNGYDTTIVGGLTVSASTADNSDPEIDINVIGVHVGRPGTVLHHQLIVTNSGGMLAKSVPIWTAAPTSAYYTPDYTAHNTFVSPDNQLDYQDSVPTTIAVDTLFGQPFGGKLNNFMIPALNAGQSFSYPYSVQLPSNEGGTVELDFWPSQRMYGSPFEWDCVHAYLDLGLNLAGLIPAVGCVASVADFALNTGSGIVGLTGLNNDQSLSGGTGAALGNIMYGLVGGLFGCVGGKDIQLAVEAGSYTEKLMNGLLSKVNATKIGVDAHGGLNLDACYKQNDPINRNKRSPLRDINSADPNGISGPEGYGVQNYIDGKGKLGYEIDFENKPTATANAQRVYLTDTLDKTKFDLSTFELVNFTVGDTSLNIPFQRTEYTSTIDLRPKQNVLLRFNAKLDTVRGLLTCSYLSLDPATRDTLPSSDLRGFLPPDVDNRSGLGSVTYVVKLKNSLVTNDNIPNAATIVFDNNAAIPTNTWLNTLDKTAPTGGITGADKINDTTVLLHLGGGDVGAGISHYILYLAANNGPFVRAGVSMTDTVRFTGWLDSAYQLYAVPYDSVNNNNAKSTADYSVTFQPGALPLLVTNFSGQYVKGTNELTATLSNAINVKTVELQKSADGYHFSYLANMATAPAINGTHTYKDLSPYDGKNYYRLRVIDNDGNVSLSSIILLDNAGELKANIYPNPFDGYVQVQFTNARAGSYHITIADAAGRKLQASTFTLGGGNQAITLPVSSYAKGVYFATVTDASDNIILNQKIVRL